MEFYEACLRLFIVNYELTPTGINLFLANLNCQNGKNAYYHAIRAFCNWLYRQGYIKDNPITRVDAPKMTKVLLPSLTCQQVEYLIEQAETIRYKAIISLFADSGIRLSCTECKARLGKRHQFCPECGEEVGVPPILVPPIMRDSCKITTGGNRENKKVFGGADISDSQGG